MCFFLLVSCQNKSIFSFNLNHKQRTNGTWNNQKKNVNPTQAAFRYALCLLLIIHPQELWQLPMLMPIVGQSFVLLFAKENLSSFCLLRRIVSRLKCLFFFLLFIAARLNQLAGQTTRMTAVMWFSARRGLFVSPLFFASVVSTTAHKGCWSFYFFSLFFREKLQGFSSPSANSERINFAPYLRWPLKRPRSVNSFLSVSYSIYKQTMKRGKKDEKNTVFFAVTEWTLHCT